MCLLLVKLKRFDEAEVQLQQVLDGEKVLYGPNSANIIETYKLLAMVYKVNGKRKDMINVYENVHQIYVRNFGPRDKKTKQIESQIEQLIDSTSIERGSPSPTHVRMPTPERRVLSPSKALVDTSMWEAHVDPDSGDTYYHNTETDETTWDKPEGFVHDVVEVPEEIKQDAKRMAQLVMKIADRHCQNGLLTINELRTFLGQVSDPFCRWLTGDIKQFQKYDHDLDGVIDVVELEHACTDFLMEQAGGCLRCPVPF